MIPTHRQPTHPGEILLREFLEPMGLTQMELAHRMGVPIQRVNTLINGKRDMTAETAVLLRKSGGVPASARLETVGGTRRNASWFSRRQFSLILLAPPAILKRQWV